MFDGELVVVTQTRRADFELLSIRVNFRKRLGTTHSVTLATSG